MYGLKCYRKNPAHFAEFAHPGHPSNQPYQPPASSSGGDGAPAAAAAAAPAPAAVAVRDDPDAPLATRIGGAPYPNAGLFELNAIPANTTATFLDHLLDAQDRLTTRVRRTALSTHCGLVYVAVFSCVQIAELESDAPPPLSDEERVLKAFLDRQRPGTYEHLVATELYVRNACGGAGFSSRSRPARQALAQKSTELEQLRRQLAVIEVAITVARGAGAKVCAPSK